MSFVGPRPLPELLLKGLDTEKRSKIRSGWTGPAQIYLTRHGKLDKHLQIRLDNYYVYKRSFFYNCRLLVATIYVLFHRKKLDMNKDASADRKAFLQEKEKHGL